jgi:hypothetical protein
MQTINRTGAFVADDHTVHCGAGVHTMRVYRDGTLVLLNHQRPALEWTLTVLGAKPLPYCLQMWHLHRADRQAFWWAWHHPQKEAR